MRLGLYVVYRPTLISKIFSGEGEATPSKRASCERDASKKRARCEQDAVHLIVLTQRSEDAGYVVADGDISARSIGEFAGQRTTWRRPTSCSPGVEFDAGKREPPLAPLGLVGMAVEGDARAAIR